jgi:hypothetical protein
MPILGLADGSLVLSHVKSSTAPALRTRIGGVSPIVDREGGRKPLASDTSGQFCEPLGSFG